MRSANCRSRTRLRTVAPFAVIVASVLTATACSSGDPAPLPGSDQKVSADSPITAQQATAVRQSGRDLVISFLDRLPDNGIDTERSVERWDDCTARQKAFSFHPTINGVRYEATIFLSTADVLTIDQMHERFRDTGTTWERDDGEKGRNGVFGVRLNAGALPLGITVSSPCYYFGDVDGISVSDKHEITGFGSRKWDG